MEPRSLAEVLKDYSKDYTRANRADVYAGAFEDFPYKALEVIGHGKQTNMVVELEGDRVLKISNSHHPWGRMGKRKFDAPVLEEGHVYAEIPSDQYYTGTIHWHIQPKVRMNADYEDLRKFETMVKKLGYDFIDPHTNQIGTLNGEIVLVDLYSVVKKSGKSLKEIAQARN